MTDAEIIRKVEAMGTFKRHLLRASRDGQLSPSGRADKRLIERYDALMAEIAAAVAPQRIDDGATA